MALFQTLLGRLSRALAVDPALLLHSSFLFGATLLGQMVSFAVQIVMARRIGIESYGAYSYAFTWINLLAMLAVMGNDRLIIRYGSEYRAQGDRPLLQGVIRWSCCWSLGAACLLGLVFAGFSLGLGSATPEHVGVAFWCGLALPAVVAASLIEGMLRVQEAHGWATLPNRVLRPLLLGGLFLVLAFWLERAPDASTAVAANTLSIAAVALLSLWAFRPHLAPRPAVRPVLPAGLWVATSIAFGLNSLALHLNGQVDTLVLGAFHGEEVLGIYGAVTRIVTVMGFAGVAVITIVQPMMVRALAGTSPAEMQRLVTGGARLVCLTSLAFAVPILLFAGPLLRIFGDGFEAGAPALRILALGALASSPLSLAGALLGMGGHERQATAIMIGGCILTLALNLLLAPRYGVVGAATATAVSRVLWNLAMFRAAQSRLGIMALPLNLSACSPSQS